MKVSFNLVLSSTLTLFLSTFCSISLAYLLGSAEFGLFAAINALAIILMPIISFRLETRIAVCETYHEASNLRIAINSVALIFLVVALLIFIFCRLTGQTILYGLIPLLAVGMIIADFGLSHLAFKKLHFRFSIFRIFRQIIPLLFALWAAWLSPNHEHAVIAFSIGTWVLALVIGWSGNEKTISWTILTSVLKQHRRELKASITLGTLNGIWLNGLQPLMAWMGWHQLAGQYALLQRLINAPLSIVSVVTNTFLLGKGNDLHFDEKKVLKVFLGLTLIGVLWIVCLWVILFLQVYWILPPEWKIDSEFFYAAAFFGVCSFAVGSISVISIRLKDEWFVAFWQLFFILVWFLGVVMMDLQQIFTLLLWIGGLAYVVLLWRWVAQINLKKNHNVIK
jgi:O-antigen/teichoic acid export membrane protein